MLSNIMKFSCTVLVMVASMAVIDPLTKAAPALEVGNIGDTIANIGSSLSETWQVDHDGITYVYDDEDNLITKYPTGKWRILSSRTKWQAHLHTSLRLLG